MTTMKRDPDDVSVFGPAIHDAEHWIDEGVHWWGSTAALPGIALTSNPDKVTCRSCLRGLINGTIVPGVEP